MERTALVTGAARGIGLEICRQLLERGFTVIAAPRVPGSAELAALIVEHPERLHEVAFDVSDPSEVELAVGEVASLVEHLDVLVNNGAIYPKDGGLESAELDDIARALSVNAIGPLRVTRALLPLLRKGEEKRVLHITSLMGSIGDNSSGYSYAYRMSKAALNMANKNLAIELGREGIFSMAIYPGWVQTRMGGTSAPLEIERAVRDVLANGLDSERSESGGFKGPGGAPLPW